MPATYASLSRANLYTYTDGMVICGPPQLDPNDSERETVTNPRLIIEVVYPEAEAYVRGDKFAFYREIESLEEYVIVSQRIPQIETFFRQSGSTWLFTPTTGLSAVAKLRSLDIQLPLAEVYAGIEFSAGAGAPIGDVTWVASRRVLCDNYVIWMSLLRNGRGSHGRSKRWITRCHRIEARERRHGWYPT